jgi:hypothetical protein
MSTRIITFQKVMVKVASGSVSLLDSLALETEELSRGSKDSRLFLKYCHRDDYNVTPDHRIVCQECACGW